MFVFQIKSLLRHYLPRIFFRLLLFLFVKAQNYMSGSVGRQYRERPNLLAIFWILVFALCEGSRHRLCGFLKILNKDIKSVPRASSTENRVTWPPLQFA